jgi:uncharacterized protein
MTASSLYSGHVTHHRLRPKVHRLRYRVFWMLLDLDEIDGLSQKLRLLSRNRFNLASFFDRDHGDGSDVPLRRQAEALLQSAGCDAAGLTIRLFCMPRILGYGFNPLSVYFCYRPDGPLAAIIYQVHNTFGERHSYVLPVESAADIIEQRCDKDFYVSPFLGMDMSYDFRVQPPAERISVAIQGQEQDQPVISAALSGRRSDLTDAGILKAFAGHPLLTLKVIAGIHWHALRMVLRGFRIEPRQPAVSRATPAAPRHQGPPAPSPSPVRRA